MPRTRGQRGAIAVELGLTMPILILVTLGGLQLGRALVTRHHLELAANYATRKAAVTGRIDRPSVASDFEDRMGDEIGKCASWTVTVVEDSDPSPIDALQVTVTCQLAQPFTLVSFVDELTVVVSMPR